MYFVELPQLSLLLDRIATARMTLVPFKTWGLLDVTEELSLSGLLTNIVFILEHIGLTDLFLQFDLWDGLLFHLLFRKT